MTIPKLILTLLFTSISMAAQADWNDLLKQLPDSAKDALSTTDVADVTGVSTEEMTAGLKEALSAGTEIAVSSLGQEGGYLDNPAVKIPMPDELSWIESGLRQVG